MNHTSRRNVPVTFENMDSFQHQYAGILAAKYSKDPADFFTYKYISASGEDLAGSLTHYVRVFECDHFEYDGKQYNLNYNRLRFPSVENDDLLHLEISETRQTTSSRGGSRGGSCMGCFVRRADISYALNR